MHYVLNDGTAASVTFTGSAGRYARLFPIWSANSIDAPRQKGTLHVRTAGPVNLDGKRPMVALTIADTGSGIAPEHVKRVLEPFFTTSSRSALDLVYG
jgi:two-component system, NtrC family, sensor kinase